MIIFSDLHLSRKTRDVALDALREIGNRAAEHGDDHVAFLGDFLEIRHVVHVSLLLEAIDVMRQWPVKRITFLPGNHDQVNVDGRNALEFFEALPNASVYTDPTWDDCGLWIPYRHSHEEIQEALAIKPPKKTAPKVLFAHLAVSGAWMNNHVANTDGVDDSLFKGAGFKQVFLGHYHKHQTIRKGMRYIGSPYQVTYGEAGQDKGYMRWVDGSATFHALEVGPRHYKVVIDADHPDQSVALPEVREGDKLWVQVRGHMAGAMRDVVAAHLDKAGLPVERMEVDLQPSVASSRLDRDIGDTADDLAQKFVDAQDVDDQFKVMLMRAWGDLQ